MVESNKIQLGVAAGLAGAASAVAAMALMGYFSKGASSQPEAQTGALGEIVEVGPSGTLVCVIGDVGGTNVRLTLRKLDLRTRTSVEIKPLTKIPSQEVKSFSAALAMFLEEFDRDSENWPKIGVIGIAGEVKNNCVDTTNCPHWNKTDGLAVAQEFGMDRLELVNDFVAAGHGLLQLQEKDYDHVQMDYPVEPRGVKVVLGPGTGHGQACLVQSKFSPCYEVYPGEGGHTEFAPRTDFDMKLVNFAKNYIETSNNVENKRGKGPVDRISHERLGAGPGVPLIYEFMKQEYPDMERILETGPNGKNPDDIEAQDIVIAAMEGNDPLCNKTVDKFSEIFAVQAGDTALKYLPYGGIYLIGGVTNGIREKILKDKSWLNHFNAKGRCSHITQRFPVMILNPETELGILGAEEQAYRLCGSYSV